MITNLIKTFVIYFFAQAVSKNWPGHINTN